MEVIFGMQINVKVSKFICIIFLMKVARHVQNIQNRKLVISVQYIKGRVTDMRYFVRSKFSRSLVHKKNFSLIWQVVFKLGYVFCQER